MTLILIRHGESFWNPPRRKGGKLKGWRYAGSADVPLSEDGIAESIEAGKLLKAIPIDTVYCSMLIRAQMTALIALAAHDFEQTPLLVRDNPDPHAARGLRAHFAAIYNPPPADEEETEGETEQEVNRIVPIYCSNALNYGDVDGIYHFPKVNLLNKSPIEL
jgi:broad specificity phosphatase PhoE